jgi:hypothetical protein
LSAGYRFLGRRIELLIIPILLDLLFWLGPRLSIAPIFQQMASLYTQVSATEGMSPDMVDMIKQAATTFSQMGEQSNLLNSLANTTMLHVPSLMAGSGVNIGPVIEIQSPLAAISLLIGFSLLGVLIGVVYMNMLARTLPLGDGAKPATLSQFATNVVRHFVMVILYVLLIIGALMIGAIPVTLIVALLSLLNPYIGSLIFMLFIGVIMVLLFYLYFVTAGLILDDLPVYRAITQSFLTVRNNFWPTLGFIVLYTVISLGFAYLLINLATMTPVGTVIAILVYAYIGSGLAMALLVFYRTRLLKQDERLLSAMKP